jgi:hypothetical protein
MKEKGVERRDPAHIKTAVMAASMERSCFLIVER